MLERCGCEVSGHEHRREHTQHEDATYGICHCGCGGRRFLSKREKIKMLEDYRRSLEDELEGVVEELKSLKGDD